MTKTENLHLDILGSLVFIKFIAKTVIFLFVHPPRNIKQTITTKITLVVEPQYPILP
jgi:hypothetical protein